MLSRTEAQKIIDEVLSYTHADETEVSVSMGISGNLRFAQNVPTTTGASTSLSVSVSCVHGKRVGSFSTTEIDSASLKDAVHRADELARLAPENPEYMPRLGAQTYSETPGYDGATAKLGPAERVKVAKRAIDTALPTDLIAAGFYSNGSGMTALGNSRGLFGYSRSTNASYSLTVRTNSGSGSGWAAAESHRAKDIDDNAIALRAANKALLSRSPQPIEPGAYPVILEPSAVGDMLNLYFWSMGRRAADEGRSYFSEPGGGTKIGQKLFDDRLTIYSDPMNPIVPSIPWGDDGLPLGRTVWCENGVQKELPVGRFWAEKNGLKPVPYGSNIIMNGESHTLDELIASMKYGLLVTSFWYIRQVDPKTVVNTGLTRDGVFLIEKGKITKPVINLRWNESPIAVFKNIEMMSRPERIVTREGNQPMLAPALKLKEFHFTSVSTSI
ncbi:MAG: TldD/PmbA family protein [Bacteroidetes bacterium]|nr:TldD/PmbA family protein [Bacteroidota bacterium]